MNIRSTLMLAAVLAGSLSLAACGSDDGPDVTAQVPAEASQSAQSFYQYVRDLVASSNTDALEPVSLAAVTNPPETNDAEPQTLN